MARNKALSTGKAPKSSSPSARTAATTTKAKTKKKTATETTTTTTSERTSSSEDAVSTGRGKKRAKRQSSSSSPASTSQHTDSQQAAATRGEEAPSNGAATTENENNEDHEDKTSSNNTKSRKKRRSKSPSHGAAETDKKEGEPPQPPATAQETAERGASTITSSRTPNSDSDTTFWSAKTDASLPMQADSDDNDNNAELNVKRQLFAENSKNTFFSPPPPPPPPRTNQPLVTPEPKSPPSSQLDVFVHRIRHLNLVPRSILRLVATPPPPPSTSSDSFSSTYLALSRQGGSVQVLAVDQKYRSVHYIAGLRDRNVDALAWLSSAPVETEDSFSCLQHAQAQKQQEQRRLFGGSRDGTLFELDLTCHLQKGVMGSGGGAVFAMTPLHPSGSAESSCGYLATANEDGCVRIFRAASEQTKHVQCLDLIATLPSAGAPVLSIAWRSAASTAAAESVLHGSTLYAGCADGTIRRYDCAPVTSIPKQGGADGQENSSLDRVQWKATLRMKVDSMSGRRTHWTSSSSTRVWALLALSDGTVVSGDSLGHVQIWNGASGTLLQTFQQSEVKADVLDLALSFDESRIFAAGIDPRVICLQRYAPQNATPASWVLSHAQIPHTHDVKALTIGLLRDASGSAGSGVSSPGEELLFSAGVDTKLCTYKVADFQGPRPRRINPCSMPSPLCLSKKERVLALLTAEGVQLHQLASSSSSPRRVDHQKTLIGSIATSGPYNLVCSDISDDGRFLAVSHGGGLLMFSMHFSTNRQTDRRQVTPTPVDLPPPISDLACTVLKFSPIGSSSSSSSPRRLFCALAEGPVRVLQLEEKQGGEVRVTVEHEFEQHFKGGAKCPVSTMAVSPDHRWLVVGRNTLGSHAIHVFCLSSLQHWWRLPALEAPHSCLDFLGDAGNSDMDATLAVACCNNGFYLFDLDRQRLGEWSLDAGFPLTALLPPELKERSDYAQRLVYHPATPNQFLLGGLGFFCAIHLDRAVPERAPIYPPHHVEALRYKKRRWQEEEEEEEEDNDEGVPSLGRKRPTPAAKNFTLCLRYNGILFMDFVQENEMVLVERPWLSTLESLPDALEQRVYGT